MLIIVGLLMIDCLHPSVNYISLTRFHVGPTYVTHRTHPSTYYSISSYSDNTSLLSLCPRHRAHPEYACNITLLTRDQPTCDTAESTI